MIASVHILTSAALSKGIDNIYILPFAALALHFLVDMIPHYDYRPFEEISPKKSVFLIIADNLFGVFAVFLLSYFNNWNFAEYYAASIAIFFGLLPDILSKSFKLFILKENKYAVAFRAFHKKLHLVFINYFITDFHKGFYQQVAVSTISIIVLLYAA